MGKVLEVGVSRKRNPPQDLHLPMIRAKRQMNLPKASYMQAILILKHL